MKKKQFIIGILVIIIVLLAVFLYLYLTRNEILYNIPGFFSDRAPTFQYYLQGDPRNPMDSPMGVAVDGTGNVYVTDADKDCVVVFDRSGQVLRMFGSSGTGNGQFNYPYGIAIHHDEVYVADKGNYRVEVFSLIGEYMRTVVQSSQSGLAGVFEPTGIAVSGKNGDIYITDLLGHRVIIFNNQGQYIRDVGSAES
jgi:DNA-binding beta-propeller fold protein YncE